ncbi:serine-pyruvate aminotransferase/archaeal aspartate aminotransferase [Longilinea arvoryzae]|uniref:Serine-pyruvate aminotransferase/archaeal aspartate aminotransferase n=1 Tax=Longilinea arvoryzae TaxID=360412 RepID=A0A0S7BEF5_9CHLR|nr:alanine--glyoxylate aminotransferase family protein [Longilinea arvoryzae]GAP13833.1 serine-pyruvate aminotransferase/archaeal aspartate aminotransferase [Longilinea arvoryzae]
METYPIPMIPGPVRVPPEILAAYQKDYGSADLEPEFLDLYNRTERELQQLFGTKNSVVIHTGEGMLVLWGALKSCLKPGDRVVAVANGVFSFGLAEMAEALGASVKVVPIPYNQTITDWQSIEVALADYRPKMITVVHCETPSGTLNPLEQLGKLKHEYEVPLLLADVVSSVGGAPVKVDEWGIDLALGGSQKVLSCPPDMSFVTVSDAAWEIIEQVNYPGYDAIRPFYAAQKTGAFPYTPYWQGLSALHIAAQRILDEGLEHSFQRHAQVADYCRQRLIKMGLSMYPARSAITAPTVSAVNLPEGIDWPEFDRRLRTRGLAVGGSYGPLAGKVFRLGHMGSQADLDLTTRALDVIEEVFRAI